MKIFLELGSVMILCSHPFIFDKSDNPGLKSSSLVVSGSIANKIVRMKNSKANIPTILTMNPRTDTTSNRSCFTSGGSTNLSTASDKMKNDMKSKNRAFINPASTSALT